RRRVLRAVVERDVRALTGVHAAVGILAAAHDVEVRDDVALLIPHEPRAGALRNLLDVERDAIARRVDRRDVDDRARELLEDIDRPLLVRAELVVGALSDRPRLEAAGL